MWRDTYRRCVDPEAFLGATVIRTLLAEAGSADPEATAPDLPATLDAVRTWSAEQSGAYRELRARADRAGSLDALTHAVLRQSSPLASSLGAWLQGMSAPAVFEDDTHLRILALFADDMGVGGPRSSRHDAFKMLATQAGRPELAVDAAELAAERPIRDHLFALPAALFAISRRSDEFAPVIAGIDVAMRTAGLLPCWSALRPQEAAPAEWARLDLAEPTGATSITAPPEVSRTIADRFRATGPEARRRVDQGAAWALTALTSWNDLLLEEAAAALDPRRAMEQLIRERAREGCVYHQGFRMGDSTLSELLARAQTDPAPLLRELAATRMVKAGRAERSSLVNGLIGPKGPMFRVFSPDDVGIISNWIDALADPEPPVAARPAARVPEAPRPGALDALGPGEDGVAPTGIREAFHVLQGRALAPETRGFAVRYVKRWLARAKLSVGRTDRSLPERWTPAGLRPWLLDKHDKHGVEFEAGASNLMPSREEVIDSTLQLAPLTLIDGAWLQGFTDVGLAATRFGFPLFETYWDELGNGDIEINHPKIYRDVLREMGIELAPTGSREFAYDTRFREESLERPVYWLCLGKLPNTFLPEILGMNLAMELSGVGGSYRTARTFLKHYGFSTHFVDLHNTIDNVSTGHSAWAADAIDTHMRAVAKRSGPEESAAEWERVRVGYESLAPLPSKIADLIGYRFQRSPWRARPQGGSLFPHTPVEVS
ncbi:iron-containing redox enzyme family protein [Streptomyces solincola]|uniref:Iron-containing redox enzyme family protein n=1 Tax=Streptomyces solincola TaxID=2100817 RepID=A0A2S9PZF3_9ACTN|nr:iron-containing redox enzyme family protein [Streptomyces solincola]PRH79806.1 iron-containing redox enzyme family protein [Streptomyces solincola]